jgi:hypothetical protein
MSTQAAPLTRLEAALEAANTMAHHAALALEEQRQGQGLNPKAYRKRIQIIQNLTWCALNDLGQAKRMAVLARREETQRIDRALLQYSESMLRELSSTSCNHQVLQDLAESARNVLLAKDESRRIRECQMVGVIARYKARKQAGNGGAA